MSILDGIESYARTLGAEPAATTAPAPPPGVLRQLQGDNSWALSPDGLLPRRARGARGTSDKTGQATRERQKASLLKKHGPYCHICLAHGLSREEAWIDLELRWPDPRCFTRDHLKPRSRKGSNGIRNLRPAHNACNASRGNRSMEDLCGDN